MSAYHDACQLQWCGLHTRLSAVRHVLTVCCAGGDSR